MGRGDIPDRWLPYSDMGMIVPGTRFLACKVPLKEVLLRKLPKNKRFGPEDLMNAWPKLGLIIDLTNTTRYYFSKDFTNKKIQYEKIFCPGKVLPPNSIIKQFFSVVDGFLERNKFNDAVIAVHCTHGVNRTGYFVCRYMIERLNIMPEDAVESFQKARGHAIERESYVDDLMNGCKGGSEQNLSSKEIHFNKNIGKQRKEHSYNVGQVNGSVATDASKSRYIVNRNTKEDNRSITEQDHADHRRDPDKTRKMSSTPQECWGREIEQTWERYRRNLDERKQMANNPPENWRREIEQSHYRKGQQMFAQRADRTATPGYFSPQFAWTPNSSSERQNQPHNMLPASHLKPLPYFCYSNRTSKETPTVVRLSKVFSPQARFPQPGTGNPSPNTEGRPPSSGNSGRIKGYDRQFLNYQTLRYRRNRGRPGERRAAFLKALMADTTVS